MDFPDLPRPVRLGLPAQPLLVESVSPSSSVTDVTKLSNLAVAQRYQASVEARLPNGHFKVTVSGQEMQMRLPEGTRPGDQLNLLLISKEPRLKFAMLSTTPTPGDASISAQRSNSNTKLHPDTQMNMTLAGRGEILKTGEPLNSIADAELSKTGRFLGTLIQDPNKSLATPLANTGPLLAGPPLNSQQLPAQLQQAMSQSGLFYESHQAQWIAGRRSLEKLLQEPQSRLSSTTSTSATSSTAPNTPAAGWTISADTPAHPQSMTLVQQQLNLLETGQLSWRGEIWPGQSMDWEITDHPSTGDEPDETPRWQTRLRINLPKLGEIVANIGLDTGGVKVSISAADDESLSRMRSQRLPLAESLSAAGLTILGVEVQRERG
jgi:hypothetical protein